MRTVGCIINDTQDYDLDILVERTKNRPLANGQISLKTALLSMLILTCALGILLFFLNITTIILAIIGALLTIIYPLSKRYIACPQIILGMTFSWGIPMAFAMSDKIKDPRAWFLYICVAIWVFAYDSIYALQDKKDDIELGIGSSAVWLGDNLQTGIGLAYTIFWLGLGMVGLMFKLSIYYAIGWLIAAYLLYWQVSCLDQEDNINYAKLFELNQWVGLTVFIGIVCSYI